MPRGFRSKAALKKQRGLAWSLATGPFVFTVRNQRRGKGFESRKIVDATHHLCEEIRKGVGKDGDRAIDFHTRFDLPDAVRLCGLIEPLNPLFVEDPVRSENPEVYRTLRPMVKVPLAVGEH